MEAKRETAGVARKGTSGSSSGPGKLSAMLRRKSSRASSSGSSRPSSKTVSDDARPDDSNQTTTSSADSVIPAQSEGKLAEAEDRSQEVHSSADPEVASDENAAPANRRSTMSSRRSSKKSGRAQGRERVNWLMHLLYARGEHKECLRLIETQLKSCDGMCEYALYVKGLILRSQGKVQEALELFQAATLLNPTNYANLKQVGRCLFLLGKHSASVDVLDEATLCARREDWEIQHNKGVCYMFLKDYEKALEAFHTANSIQRHDSTFIEMGKIHTATGDLKQAIEVYLEALEFSPDNPELLTTVGLLYLRDGENFKAFEYLGNSLTHDPRNAKTILAAGSVIQDHSDMDVALVKYRVAAVQTPNSAQLWNNIGMCFFGKERYVAAVACLKRSLYLDPFQWITAHNLGLVFMHSGQYASAFHYLSTSINLKPSYAASYMYLAIVLSRLEDGESAVAAYGKAIQLDPDDPICHLNFASTLHNMGERERARAEFDSYSILCSRMSSDERRALMEACGDLHAQVSRLYGA